MDNFADLFHDSVVRKTSNWNEIEICNESGSNKFDKIQLVVTVEFVQASQCVIGLLPLKGWSGCTEDGTYPCKKLLKNQIKQKFKKKQCLAEMNLLKLCVLCIQDVP